MLYKMEGSNIDIIFQLQDLAEYQLCLSDEIEARLKAKCDKLADAFVMEDIGLSLSIIA